MLMYYINVGSGNGLLPMAPSHYLNQCWLVISDALWHSSEGNFTGNAQDIHVWYKFDTLRKTKICHNANNVITGGTVGCDNDNLRRCHQWWQSWHYCFSVNLVTDLRSHLPINAVRVLRACHHNEVSPCEVSPGKFAPFTTADTQVILSINMLVAGAPRSLYGLPKGPFLIKTAFVWLAIRPHYVMYVCMCWMGGYPSFLSSLVEIPEYVACNMVWHCWCPGAPHMNMDYL